MKEPLRSIVYRQLREKIISCEFEPNSFLTEDQLMEISGTSRTPVREAIQKLEDERFVRVFPKRGIYVCEMTVKDLREVFEIRKLAEPFAVSQYGYRVSRDSAQKTAEALDSNSSGSAALMHALMCETAASAHLRDVIELMYAHSLRLMCGSGLDPAEGDPEIQQSEAAAVRLMLDGRCAEAAQLLGECLDKEEQRIYEAMRSTGIRV